MEEESEQKPVVEGDGAEAESEAPEADQTETGAKVKEEEEGESRGTKRRHDDDGGRYNRDHRRSRFDDKPLNIEMENDDWVQLTSVVLDKYNSDLNLRIQDNGIKANPITVEGFAFMWAGARATYGVSSGKVGFEVKLLEQLAVDHLPEDETTRMLSGLDSLWIHQACN
jgi:heterogeneous nuclear ribonucleoprotein U-like protein 1